MEKASVKSERENKTYIFRVVVEPDEDRWHAYCPALEVYAAATWDCTRAEALNHIQELVEMIVEELAEDGKPVLKVRWQ